MKLSIKPHCHLILLLLLAVNTFAQSNGEGLVLKTFVKEDRVLLRWAPTSAERLIKGLKNGYLLERITGAGTFENNPSLQSFAIAPFDDRKALFANAEDETIREMVGFVEALLSPSVSHEAKSVSFAVLMLGAGSNKEIAQLLGVYFEDSLITNESFLYRISIPGTDEKSATLGVNTTALSANQDLTTLAGSARLKLKEAYLQWEAQSLTEGYSAYWIERSTDKVNFERRNTVPYLFFKTQYEPGKKNCDFVDTAVVEGVTYYYRISGINHFGETGKTSNVVMVYIPKSLYGECHIDTVRAEAKLRQLSGHFMHTRPTNELTRFQLYRSDSLLHGYSLLAEKQSFADTFTFTASVSLESGDRHYYKVAALSADNDTVYSFPYYFFTLDQIPPLMPAGLRGSVNDSGVVSLSWTANPEQDIRGYRVFRSNDLKEEFTEVTTTFCTVPAFTDTLSLGNLTSLVYYRVAAVDFNFNNSGRCEPVLLAKPDTIPPVPVVFLNYSVEPAGVRLDWINSTSTDLSKNVLLRRSGGQIDTLSAWQDDSHSILDTTVEAGKTYTYCVFCTDRSGNSTLSDPVRVNYETGTRTGVSHVEPVVNRNEQFIAIGWILPEGEIYSIQVYRSKNDEPFRLVETLREQGATSFRDKDLTINNTYRYKIKVIYKTGVSSVLSDPVMVIY